MNILGIEINQSVELSTPPEQAPQEGGRYFAQTNERLAAERSGKIGEIVQVRDDESGTTNFRVLDGNLGRTVLPDGKQEELIWY